MSSCNADKILLHGTLTRRFVFRTFHRSAITIHYTRTHYFESICCCVTPIFFYFSSLTPRRLSFPPGNLRVTITIGRGPRECLLQNGLFFFSSYNFIILPLYDHTRTIYYNNQTGVLIRHTICIKFGFYHGTRYVVKLSGMRCCWLHRSSIKYTPCNVH